MLSTFTEFIGQAAGLDSAWIIQLSHMIFRATIIYFFGVTLARFNKKLLGIRTPFNFMLFVMLGSIAANAIAIKTLFLPTIGMLLFLTTLNGLMTMFAFYFPKVEFFIKGKDSVVVKDGKIQWSAMKHDLITKRELLNELQAQLHTTNLDEVKEATLASDGTINFIEKN